ncbi:MAG: SMC-Scp complex subunit ScpB [Acidobacteriota bacterium]
MRDSDRAGAVEAILFVASEPVSIQQFLDAFDGQVSEAQLMQALAFLEEAYKREGCGIALRRVAEGYQLVTRSVHAPFARNFLKAQNLRKLTPAALEVLAIVAYKQPLTSAEISHVRGTESGSVLRGLLEKKLVRIAGRKQVVGRPLLYSTTKDFLVHFGLNSLDDLPSFRELEEVFREGVRQESLFKNLDNGGGRKGREEESPQPLAAVESPEDDTERTKEASDESR